MKFAVLLASILLACAGLGLAPAGATTHPPAVPFYVALGDSRAAGPTWTSMLSGDHCGRTADSYPSRIAAALHVSYRSVACSGAKTSDVLGAHWMSSAYTPAQVDALSARTRLVTLSIGGNDIDWSGLIAPCFPLGRRDGRCRSNSAMETRITKALTAFAPKLDRVLDVITGRSPQAQLVVVGHGGYFGARGCAPDAPMSDADAPTVAAFFARFNSVLRSAAVHHGALYVDITGPATGHDACAGDQRWFVGDAPRGHTPTRHPTPLGSRNIARLVVDELAKSPWA